MVIDGMKRAPYSAETQQLLKEKNLQCICELCDCGFLALHILCEIQEKTHTEYNDLINPRYDLLNKTQHSSRHHRHENCTKTTNKVKTVLERPGLKECCTNYQSSYRMPPCQYMRKIRRPLPRLRNPNPPPMDFRTVTNTEYIRHDDFEGPPKPFKLEDSHQNVSNEEFDSQTSYAAAYTNRGQPSHAKLTRPVTTTSKHSKYKFSNETTHNATFNAKKAEPVPSYTELPSFMGSILYPDPQLNNLVSVNQQSYRGEFGPKSEFCGPREAVIKLGTEGDYDHQTVHRATYKKHDEDLTRSAKVQKPSIKLVERAQFNATTQAQRDFPRYKKGTFPLPAKPCAPHPESINLAMNSAQDFTTTNRERYKGQWDVKLVKVKAKEATYSPPKEKFHTTTQTMADFQPKETTCVPLTKPIANISLNRLKLADETSYKVQFPKYDNVSSFKRYGDFHEHGFYLKPVQKFDEQGGSVTTNTFTKHSGVRLRTSYKPKQTYKSTKDEVTGESVYRTTFKQKTLEECAYVKYLADHGRIPSSENVVSA